MHILSPETDNCSSWISGRERMTVENISWSISTKDCCRPRLGLNPQPPGLQSDRVNKYCVWSGSVLFAKAYLSQYLGLLQFVAITTGWVYTRNVQLKAVMIVLIKSLSYTMIRAHVACDNARAWASALSHVHAHKHGTCITDLSHFHECRSSTSWDISCWMLGI